MTEREPIVRAEGLTKHFPIRRGLLRRTVGQVRAVDGVDLTIERGEVLGLIGESGSGKSTIGRLLLRLLDATDGRVELDGRSLMDLDRDELRAMRTRMQMVFQDPLSSLNPRMSARQIVEEPLVVHRIGDASSRRDRVTELFDLVGLDRRHLDRLPGELSGGQRQRIGIARALATAPDFIVADECLASLDVSVQAQVVNLLRDLQETLSLTYLFITHDLRMASYLCDRVVVLYLGRVVEVGTTETVTRSPRHPYTMALLSAVPSTSPAARRDRIVLEGEIPSPANPPSGCRFRTRCAYAVAACHEREPELRMVDGREVACHRAEEITAVAADAATATRPAIAGEG